MQITGKYAASSLALKQGIIIDLAEKCYTRFIKLFGIFKFKQASAPLPKVDYILLFKTLYNKCQACATDDFDNSDLVQLSFVYDGRKKLIVHESTDFTYIKQLAQQLAAELHVSIKDSATDRRNPKWLN